MSDATGPSNFSWSHIGTAILATALWSLTAQAAPPKAQTGVIHIGK